VIDTDSRVLEPGGGVLVEVTWTDKGVGDVVLREESGQVSLRVPGAS
jgi:hypothetical protein